MKIRISQTGEIHGRGSDQWKWVSKLTDEEREAVRNGETVVIPDEVGPGRCGLKRVVYNNGRYYHREATPDILVAVAR